jgi:hypothetical protein
LIFEEILRLSRYFENYVRELPLKQGIGQGAGKLFLRSVVLAAQNRSVATKTYAPLLWLPSFKTTGGHPVIG